MKNPVQLKELFIVEGLSAASTLKQAANFQLHQIHPLQGKLINVAKASPKRVMANEICQQLLAVLACGAREHCSVEQLNFSRIIIVSDPDVDGTHSRLLLLRFFQHYLSALVEAGRVYVIIPPLYRIHYPALKRFDYAWDEQQRMKILAATQADSPEVMRIKGVAQFSQQACGELFLNSVSRRLFRVELKDQQLQLAQE